MPNYKISTVRADDRVPGTRTSVATVMTNWGSRVCTALVTEAYLSSVNMLT